MPIDLEAIAGSLSALLVPPRCMVCTGRCDAAASICARCLRALRSAPFGVDQSLAASQLDRTFATHEYSGAVSELVKALKYSGRTGLAYVIAELIAARLPPGFLKQPVALVPVPAHPSNRRARGFNQSLLIAKALGARIDAPVVDCLIRSGHRPPQSQLGRAERLRMPEGEFQLRTARHRQLAGQALAELPTNVVVCDDVTTTTCTLEACASAIRERHSVQTIHGLAFASASPEKASQVKNSAMPLTRADTSPIGWSAARS